MRTEAKIELGLSFEEFWNATPPEYFALWRAKHRQIRAEQAASNLRAGLITAAIYNTLRQKRGDKFWEPKDFFRLAETEKKESNRASSDDLIQKMDALARFVGNHGVTR